MTQKRVRTFFAASVLLAASLGSVLTSTATSAGAASLLKHNAAGLQNARAAVSKKPVLHLVAGDCAAIGQQVAAQQGGTLTKATAAVQNGAPVCIVVVLVPGRDGERPRRVEVAVPAK